MLKKQGVWLITHSHCVFGISIFYIFAIVSLIREMITIKLKIKNRISITADCENYSRLFRKLYSNSELIDSADFEEELRKRFNMDSFMFESCKIDVRTKLSQQKTIKGKKVALLNNLEKEIAGVASKRYKYRLYQKIAQLKSSLGGSMVFGGKSILRKISFLSNDKIKNEKEIRAWTEKYNQHRLLPIYIVGDTATNSNRKFDFDFINKIIIFKPKKGIKMPIEFHCRKNQYKQLVKLQQMIGTMPISIRLNNDYIWIIFDEEKLNGFAFNGVEYFKELKTIPARCKQERKDCAKKWVQEKELRMLIGKNPDRFISFDLNPEYIGFAILEKTREHDFGILFKQAISLTELNTKIGLSSSDPIQIKQNNKRIHELHQVWKYIFNIARHYRVANCSIEDLEFKEKSVNSNSSEANRKTRNLWHRTLTTNIIRKYCNTIGVKLIPVNACYSSFIGNIKYNFFDPISSAIEIGRRGITKYLKGGFYPSLGRSDFDAMYQLGLDVQNKTISTWVEAYKLFKTSGLRYRRELKNFVENNLMSHKSSVRILHFDMIS
jgi:IS605 OrfB family transposase